MARHIKQVSREPQAAQINLLHHQRTELPQHRYKKKKSHAKPRQGNSKPLCRNDPHQGQKIKRQPLPANFKQAATPRQPQQVFKVW